MSWNRERQHRFDELRYTELSGLLTDDERAELAALTSVLEADEVSSLAPAVVRLQTEQQQLRLQLDAVQTENIELSRLLSQQEQLVADARRWLAQFEQRHRAIQQSYARPNESV